MTSVYSECLRMVQEHEGGMTYEQAALLVDCDGPQLAKPVAIGKRGAR